MGRINKNKIIECWRMFLDRIFSRKCPMCQKILPIPELPYTSEKLICEACAKKLIYCVEPICKKCGKPLSDERAEYCGDCNRRKHLYIQGRSALYYDGPVKDSIFRFKFANQQCYADYYGNLMWELHGTWIARCGIDLIMPMPLHPSRKRQRGYNQAMLLANIIEEKSGLPLDEKNLIKRKETKSQKELTKEMRRKNLQGAFLANPRVVKGQVILLVDDIYTTGMTVNAVSEALYQAGAKGVYVLTTAIGGS